MSLKQAAKLLDSSASLSSNVRGSELAYDICLARCCAPIPSSSLATPQVCLGKDWHYLQPVLRRLARCLTEKPSSKQHVDLVISAAKALAAVSALLVFGQRCELDTETLSQIAAPLRSRCAPALVPPLLATDLRIVSAARDALAQVVLLRVAHQTPWIDVLITLRSFRAQYTAAAAQEDSTDKNSLLNVVLVRTAALMRNVFTENAIKAATEKRTLTESDATPELGDGQYTSWLRRRSSVSITQAPVRLSAKSSFRMRDSDDAGAVPVVTRPGGGERRSRRFMGKLDKLRPLRIIQTRNGGSGNPLIRTDSFASDNESFEAPNGSGMRFSKRVKRLSEVDGVEPDSLGSKISLDSTPNPPRRSVDLGKLPRARRDSLNGGDVRRIASYHRRKRKNDMSQYFRAEITNACKWNGQQLGVENRDISAGMHIYERLLSRELLPDIRDRCEVIEDLRRLVEPLFTGSMSLQQTVDPAALRCIVANAFLAHGRAIYPALLSLVFQPAPSSERTAEVKRHLSLQPEWVEKRCSIDLVNQGSAHRTLKANDFNASIVESMGALHVRSDGEGDGTRDPQHNVCLPNSECDPDTALRCSALLTLLVEHVAQLCTPRIPIVTGTTNCVYWHCAEALVETNGRNASNMRRSMTPVYAWTVGRLWGAMHSLVLLNASLPETHEKALETICADPEQLDCVIETCMRSICASGCRLARIDARHSETELTNTGVMHSARAWATLSNLPSQSVLWPASPAYSSAIVFVAHLARRAACSVFERGDWASSADPSRPAQPPLATSPGIHKNNSNANDRAMVKALQSCIGVLVNRNGSAVIVHDLFRTLLYIIGCELRGSPTRAALGSTAPTLNVESEQVISRANASAASLPSRAPFFTRAAHQEVIPQAMMPSSHEAHHSCSDIDVVDVQSLKCLSLDESDMSGLLVGNIAVDGSRDCKLREIAAKAEGSAVATWFTTIASPVPTTAPVVREGAPPLRRRARSADRPPAVLDAFMSPPTRVADDHFEELSTACALVLNAVSVAAAIECEDATVPMDRVADDVAKAKCVFVSRMHERAVAILGRSRLGGAASSGHNPTALVQQVKTLQAEVSTLRAEVEALKQIINGGDDTAKRQRWPLKSFSRNIDEVVTNSLKRQSFQS